MTCVYVLDDDPVILAAIRERFEAAGHEVVVSGLWSELATALIATREPGTAALICDLHMPGIDGADFVQIVRRYNADMPIVLFSGDSREALAQAAARCGASVGLHKSEMSRLPSLVGGLLAAAHEVAHAG